MSISILIQELKKASREGTGVLDTEWCAAAFEGLYTPLDEQIDVSYRAELHAEVVQVAVELKGRFSFQCSRCAERSEIKMETAFSHHFVMPGSLDVGDDEADFFEADPDVSEHDGERVELRELCIEYVALALPAYPVCSDSCRGLCLQCGINLNVDTCDCASAVDPFSPWSVLQDFEIDKQIEPSSN